MSLPVNVLDIEGAMDGADDGNDDEESVVGAVTAAHTNDATEKAQTVRMVTFLWDIVMFVFGVVFSIRFVYIL